MSFMKFKYAIYTTIEIILAIILSIMSCMFDFVNLEFKPERVYEATFWYKTIVDSIMYSCAALLGMFFIIQRKDSEKNKQYMDTLDVYHYWWKFKMDSFETFIDKFFNPRTKKERLKKKYDSKLYWQDKFAKEQWKLDFNDAVDTKQLENYNFSSKKSKKYFNKRTMLERLRSDEFIEKNWKSMSVRYPKVNSHAFTYYLDIHFNDNMQYRVENKIAKDMPKRILEKILLGVLFAAILAMFLINPDKDEFIDQTHAWIRIFLRCMVKVLMILFNLTIGSFGGSKLFKENYIIPLENRTRILQEYVDWQKVNDTEETYADKLLKAFYEQKKLSEEIDRKMQELQEQKE